MKLDHHFIKERAKEGILDLIHTPTHHQAIDVLMKALSRKKFEESASKLGMINKYFPTSGQVCISNLILNF